jgi:mono/diheme cytochrome c family protein
MRRIVFLILTSGLIAADKPPATAQVQRGLEIFSHSTKGTACAICHALGGAGTAVAPDLTTMATYGTIHGLVATMRMSMTEHVMSVKTADQQFPGILKEKRADGSDYWDLSKTPPELRKLSAKEIVSVQRDQKWEHPPANAEYTSQELADLIGFLKWTTTGSVKVIKPAEVE